MTKPGRATDPRELIALADSNDDLVIYVNSHGNTLWQSPLHEALGD